MAPMAVCLSSYCFGVRFFAWLFFLQSIIMVLSIITMVPFTLFWSTRERAVVERERERERER